MSNDDQLDEQLHRMAKRSMERRASSVDADAALSEQRLRLDAPRAARGRDRRWLVAAVALALVAGGVVATAWTRGGGDLDSVATGTVATSVSDPNETRSPVEAATTTIPVRGEPTDVDAVVVADVWQTVEPRRDVLYQTSIGSEGGQLGFEDCRECDPARALNPVLLPDETIVIPDVVNSRWLVVADGTPTTIPFASDGAGLISALVSDADGLMYAVRSLPSGAAEIAVFDVNELPVPIRTYAAGEAVPFSTLQLVEAGALVNGGIPALAMTVDLGGTYHGEPQPEVVWDTLDVERPAVEVTWQDTRRRWEFAADQYIAAPVGDQPVLSDGSVLVLVGNNTDDSVQYWARLLPDGRLAAIPAHESWSFNSAASLGSSGLIQIEDVDDHLEVARYALPTPQLDGEGDGGGTLSVPALGGPEVVPQSVTVLPEGQGPGQLTLQNGEFGTPILVLPDQLLLIEDVPFDGPTGRILVLDRNGTWQFDINEPSLAGASIAWEHATPNGTILIGTFPEQSNQYRITAYRLDGTRLVEIDHVDLPALESPRPILTPTGVDYPTLGEQVLVIDTGMPEPVVSASVTRVATTSTPAQIQIERTGESAQTWTLEMSLDATSPPDGATGQAEAFGEGAWYRDVTSFAPGSVGSFLAVLEPDGTGSWWRRGSWSIAGYDGDQLILTRTTIDGLEIATVTPTSATAHS